MTDCNLNARHLSPPPLHRSRDPAERILCQVLLLSARNVRLSSLCLAVLCRLPFLLLPDEISLIQRRYSVEPESEHKNENLCLELED